MISMDSYSCENLHNDFQRIIKEESFQLCKALKIVSVFFPPLYDSDCKNVV